MVFGDLVDQLINISMSWVDFISGWGGCCCGARCCCICMPVLHIMFYCSCQLWGCTSEDLSIKFWLRYDMQADLTKWYKMSIGDELNSHQTFYWRTSPKLKSSPKQSIGPAVLWQELSNIVTYSLVERSLHLRTMLIFFIDRCTHCERPRKITDLCVYSSRISSLATVLLDAVGGWGTFPCSIVYILFFEFV